MPNSDSPIRWHATIYYRTESGLTDVEHALAEIEELQSLVERGPHWDCIERISIIRVNHTTDSTLTIERAAKL